MDAHHMKEKTRLDVPDPAWAAGPGLPGPLPAAEAAFVQSLGQTPAAAPAKLAPAAPGTGLLLSTWGSRCVVAFYLVHNTAVCEVAAWCSPCILIIWPPAVDNCITMDLGLL